MKKSTASALHNTVITFRYQGLTKNGEIIKGIIQEQSAVRAKIALHQQGIVVKKISKKNLPFWLTGKKISQLDISLFFRQLATMIQAGIPLMQSLAIVAKSLYNLRMKTLIFSIKQDIETGSTFAESLKKYPSYFSHLFCNLIDAGEKSGTLDIMLAKIAAYREKMDNIRKKIRKALTYPVVVLIIALVVSAGLLLFVVPQFEAVFTGFGAELPALTRTVITLSDCIQSCWHIMAGLGITAFYLLTVARRKSSHCSRFFEKFLLKVPLAGNIIKKASVARFARTLSITFAAGLPLVHALQAVAGATGNALFAEATEKIRKKVSTGQTMHAAMENTHLFPDMVIQMVAIGEQSGTLEHMLGKAANFFEEEVDSAIDRLSSLLEPFIMCILGILIGTLIVAMYMPVFKLGSVV